MTQIVEPMTALGETERPKLWNPDIAGVWSLFFSPIFGSIVVGKNWRTLGDEEGVVTARNWLIASIVVFLIAVFVPYGRFLGFVYLLVWYFQFQTRQTAYVRRNWPEGYDKKSWKAPLGWALLALASLWILTIGFWMILAILGWVPVEAV